MVEIQYGDASECWFSCRPQMRDTLYYESVLQVTNFGYILMAEHMNRPIKYKYILRAIILIIPMG
jgi:hypothetical protein